jgi:hypothetical protein
MTHKSRKNKKFHVFKCWMFFLRAEGFVLGRPLWRIGKFCNFVFDPKNFYIFSALKFFFQFLVIKTLDPDWIRIRNPGFNKSNIGTVEDQLNILFIPYMCFTVAPVRHLSLYVEEIHQNAPNISRALTA